MTSQAPPDPVFLLSPARSCSSVLAAMFGGHPQVYGFPELRLFIGESIAAVMRPQERLPREWSYSARSGLVRAVAELIVGSQSSSDIDAAFRWLEERSTWQPTAVFDVLRAAVAPRIALEKTPDTTHNDRNLQSCIRAYPNARFIHLVRHPVSTITSMMKYWQPVQRGFTTEKRAGIASRSWFNGHRRICALCESLPPHRVLRVRAEDALGDPGRACARFAGWLGLDQSAGAIDRMLHPERSPYARPGPPHAIGGNDFGFLSAPRLRSAPRGEPPPLSEAWGLGRTERDALARLATYFGYEITAGAGTSARAEASES